MTGYAMIDNVLTMVETMATRTIVLPSVTNAKAYIDMSTVNPEIVYTEGEKAVTISGNMKEFKALEGNEGWALYLRHTTSDHEVVIEKSKVAFLDDSYSSMSFTTTEELEVGFYSIEFEFTDTNLISAFGNKLTAGGELQVSADETYALKSYSLMSLVRRTDTSTNHTWYDFIAFTDEGDYQSFYDGKTQKTGLINKTVIQHNFGENKSATMEYEILLTVRGKLREMEDAKKGVYWQADYADGSITINNILSYEGSEPLQMYYSSGSYVIEGNGLLKVVNSINVWRSEWSYTVRDEIIYSLNPDRTSSLVGNINELTLSFGGAATMIQSIGGFLMDLSYGVMSSEWFDEGDGQVTYNIAFGGTVSIPISSKSNSDDDEASSAANNIKSADDDDEDFYIVDVSTGQVTSGATSSTSTTTTTSSTGTTTKKKSGLSGAQISADLKEVMFGEMGNVEDGKVVVEGIGFEGINTTITLGLPDNVLGSFIKNDSGLEVTMTINTLNNIYELDASIKIMIIECEATLGFKQVTVSGSDKVVPNNIAFYVKTETGGVPLVTPILYLNGLGGGIYNLADTIGGNFTTLPPVTLSLYMGLNALNLLYGDFTATASLSGLSLTGELTFKGNKSVLLVEAGISAQWTTPWNLSLYGKANFLSGVLKGTISVTIAQNYFYGYVSVTLMIPDEIFLIGGLELAKVEGAVSNTFVGGNVIILGLQYGFIYYWATGEFDLSTSIDLSAQTMSVTDEDGNEAVLIYATNMTPLKTTKVETDEDEGVFRLMDAGSAVSETAADVSGTDGIYAMLIEVPYTGNGMPSIWNLTLESPSGDEIALEASDNNGGGNFMIQDRGNSGKYIYISVTDQSLIEDGVWTLKSSADNVTLGDMNMRAVAKIPELSATSFSYDENDPFALDVSWTTDATRAIEGYVDVYLTDDADVLTKMKNSDNGTTLGYNAAHVDLGSIGDGSVSIELPEGLDSGEYYVVTMLSQQDGISYVMSADTLKFTNPNLPNSVKSVNVKYGGNGDLYIEIEDADDVDYTDYLVEITAVDGTELTNNFNRYSIDEEYIYIGKEAELEADKEYVVNVRTLRETTIQPSAGSSEAAETIYYYGSDTVSSDAYTMPEIAKPQLLSVETDFTATDNNIASDAVTITYTFDRPVWMMLDSRGESVYQVTNEFKEVWTFELTDMEDGEYIIDFTACAKTKDYVTGADFPDVENAQIGFNVDTSPPLLTLAMTDATTIDGDETTAAMNVVTADAQGYYSFGGLTELEAEMTVDGVSDSNLKVDSFGSFAYSGKLADGEKGTQHLLKAVDKAGNTAQLMVYVVSGNVSEIEKIELWNGEDNVTNGEITLDVGSTADLTVRAYYADDEDSYWEISGEEIEWEMLYENTLIRLMDGSVTALASGETALMATLPTAVMTKGDTQSTIGYSAYTIITINPGLTVTYNANGGNGAPGKDTDLAAGEYTLNSVLIPSHSNAADGTAIVFIGWSETKDETIYAKGDTVPTTVTKISLTDDTTVYALWGYDANENGTADVTEETYNLTYDANGGTSVPDAVSGLLTGEYTLSEAVPMHGNDADGNEIIFIGWSETEDATIYAKGDTTPTTVTQVTVAKDTIVYAVWGYDINENGTADVFEDTYTVSYNVNGGNGEVDTDTEVLSGAHKLSAAVPTHDDENGVTVVFIGWSETQYGTIFSSIDDMPNVVEEITVSGDTLVYAAWGYDENGNGIADIVEGAYTVSYTLEHVTLTNEAEYVIKGHGYTTEVTADGEHTISSVSVVMAGQDVTDEVYDAEKGIITISAVTGDVVITIKADQNRYTLSYDANDGDGAPTNEIGLLAGTHALSATVPTHDAVGGIAVLFIGWSLTKDAHVYAKGETAPQTVTSVTIAGDTTVYAVWGYDENENGTPDVDEDTYTLTYDANGGNNDAPDDETELLANTYTLSSVIPTHADDSNAKVVFIGWSETKDAHIYTESDTAPTTITRVTVAGDTTVYAVWGYDANNNGTADVLEGTYTIVYVLENVELDNTAAYVIAAEGYSANITVKEGCTIAEASVTMADQDITDTAYNGGTITIDSVTGNVIITIKAALNRYTVSYDANGGNDAPTNETGVLAGEYKLNTSIPTHLDENNIAVIFIGWSETKSSEIYAKGGTAPTTVTSITVAGDTTVCAAWGYDENSNGIADVNEETYTLTYDANDGNYAPDKATGLLADTYALSADTPTHADDNNTKVTFIGWSIAKDAKIYAKGETAPTTVTSVEVSEDTTVYAVWGYDEN
ncbi:MAG: InlB B-repeat-containing protein, partial [Clostridia bacterium]|nr:InlB B-repeat-containing protein [Clostridia bacterium]